MNAPLNMNAPVTQNSPFNQAAYPSGEFAAPIDD